MVRRFSCVCMLLTAACVLFSGCSKKELKAPPPEKPAPVPVPERVEAPPPAPVDSFKVEDLDAQMRAIFQTIYFAYDKSDLSPEAINTLQAIAAFLKDHSNVRVLIEGNADERGSSEYNVALGDKRARAAKNYLTNYGIGQDKLEITSYGKERPVNPNCGKDDACHAKNRRDEWKRVGN
jgi:peptidoglycan-associated lipoprotein